MKTWTEQFNAYLERHGMAPQDFALKHRIAPSKVHYWTKGSTPREEMQERIARLTDDEVPVTPAPAQHRRPRIRRKADGRKSFPPPASHS